MKKYNFLYPAIFIKDDDETYQVIFPDLNIYTNAQTMSEAYLYAKGLLKTYFSYAVRYEVEYPLPTKIEKLLPKCKQNETAMLVDAFVEE